MHSNFIMSCLRLAIIMILVSSLEVTGRPNSYNPIDGVALLDPVKVVCTVETTNLCQQCAKKTKSAVVYPWCCANHEGVQEWCEHYLHFGMQ